MCNQTIIPAMNALISSASEEATVNAEQAQDEAAVRRAARNRQIRARRARLRAEQLGDMELASALRLLYMPAASDAAPAEATPAPVTAAVAPPTPQRNRRRTQRRVGQQQLSDSRLQGHTAQLTVEMDQRQATVTPSSPPPSGERQERRTGLTPEEEAAVTAQVTSGR